jgi:hypothetical protein
MHFFFSRELNLIYILIIIIIITISNENFNKGKWISNFHREGVRQRAKGAMVSLRANNNGSSVLTGGGGERLGRRKSIPTDFDYRPVQSQEIFLFFITIITIDWLRISYLNA